MKIDTIALIGTEDLAYEVPVDVKPGLLTIGPAWIRVRGGHVFVGTHVYEIQKSSEIRLATVDLVETPDGIRISVIEESAENPYVEGPQRRKIVGQVCIAVVPAGSDTPSELRVVSAVPAPTWPLQDHEPLQVLRPDLDSAAIERSKIVVQEGRGRALVESLRRSPVDVSRGLSDHDRDRLLVALCRQLGLVTGDLPDSKDAPVSHR